MTDSSLALATACLGASSGTALSCWILDGSVPNSSNKLALAMEGVESRIAIADVEMVPNMCLRLMLLLWLLFSL